MDNVMIPKKKHVARKEPLVGMTKKQVLRIPRVSRYIEAAKHEAIRDTAEFFECSRRVENFMSRGPINLSELEKDKNYQRMLELVDKYRRVYYFKEEVEALVSGLEQDDKR